MIRFATPWLFALGVPIALLLWWRLRKLPQLFGGRRRLVQLLLSLAVAAVTLALGGLEVGARVDRLAVVFTLDQSRSMGDGLAPLETVRRSVEAMEQDDKSGLVVFGAIATTEALPTARPSLDSVHASVPREGTNIAAGLRRALADLPAEHNGRIVLVSDGSQTEGDALEVAHIAAGRGVQIDVVAVEREASPEIAVERVQVPPTARPGEPMEVRVVTRATQATRARVVISRDGDPVAEATTDIRQGSDVLVLREIAPEAGVHRYDVVVQPLEAQDDTGPRNNESGAFVRVLGGSRAIVASDAPEESQALAEAIRGAGIEVELVGPAEFPTELSELATFDVVVLTDLSARALTEAQMTHLASYVRDLGGGLLMAGARHSFGLGGYAHTPVEEVLPATFDLRRRRDRLSLAMVISIDKSGSMMASVSATATKLDLANEAAARSASLLSVSDRVGINHVDTAVSWTQPMVSVEEPERIAAAARGAQPGGGGIDVTVAMTESYAALRNEDVQLKHLLLFSDGSDSQNLSGTRELVRAAARDKITTSVVSMGDGPDTPELEHLSRLGSGRFYIVEDLTQLPAIFTQETIEASRAALEEGTFQVERTGDTRVLGDIDTQAAPPILGYAVLQPRSRASIHVRASEEDPLLLTWQQGLGRSATFATDVGAELGRPWLDWSGYNPIFSQLARHIARSPDREDIRTDLRIDSGVGRIRVDAIDSAGRYRDYLDLSAAVAIPGSAQGETLRLRQTGPGRYEATFEANRPGPYLVTVQEASAGLVGSAATVRAGGDEMRGEGTDHELLAQIAAVSGGALRSDVREVFSSRPRATWAYTPVWRYLLMFALIALLLSVAARRLVLSWSWPLRARSSEDVSTVSAPTELPAKGRSAAPEAKIIFPPSDESATSAEESMTQNESLKQPATLAERLLAKKRQDTDDPK